MKLAATALALAALVAATGLTAAGARGATAVSMGDSFISGEGGRWLGNGVQRLGSGSGTDRAAYRCHGLACAHDRRRVYGRSAADGCDRSDVAPITSAGPLLGSAVNLACSGARSVNILRRADGGEAHRGEQPQADALARLAGRRRVGLIVLTLGANDVGFGRAAIGCALDWALAAVAGKGGCRGRASGAIRAALPAMSRALGKALASIRAAMAAAGRSRAGYRLMVMGYASPIPPGASFRYPAAGWDRLLRGGCPFSDADADWAALEATPEIDDAMRSVADRRGAEYLDVRHALDGHRLCERGARLVGAAGPDPVGAEWVRRLGLTPATLRESLHPNAYGQRALGACIALAYASPPGDHACRAAPGFGYVHGMRIEPLG